MRVCDQFTNERMGRFFVPLNHEAEVHSSVDLSRTPAVVGLGVELPMVIIGGSEGKKMRGSNPLTGDDGIRLAQGEKVLGVQSYREVNDKAQRAPRHQYEDDLAVYGEERGVSSSSLEGLTHVVVELDWMATPSMRGRVVETELDEHGSAVFPIGDPIPHIDDAYEDREAFIVKGFVNSDGEMVKWSTQRSGAQWLVDLCVINTYAHNRVELGMLRYAIGHDAVLLGLVSVNEDVAAYLRNFDESLNRTGGITFTPRSEPTRMGYERKFPTMTRREMAFYDRQIAKSNRAMSTHDRSKLK